MDSRKTLFLLVLVSLGAGLVLWDHYRGTPTAARQSAAKRLVKFSATDVTRLELVRSNETIILEKSKDRWNLTAPLAVRADAGAVRALLDELEFATRIRTLSADDLRGVNLADFGLLPPRQTLRLQIQTGPITLNFGAETPTADAFYVQVTGQPEVLVAQKTELHRIQPTLDDLRNRTPLEFDTGAATRLEIKTADRLLELSRTPGARWELTRPLTARADSTKAGQLLTDLAGLRIQDFLSEKPEDIHTYHLAEPDREITVVSTNLTQTLLIGPPLTNAAGKVAAKLKDAPTIFTLTADAVKPFAVQHEEVRETRLIPWAENEITGVDFGAWAGARTTNGWQITQPVAVTADADAVREMLRQLTGWRVQEFVADVATDLERFGLAAPVQTIKVLGATTNATVELLVGGGDASNSVRYVKRADEPFIYGVAPASLAALPAQYGAVRTREIFNLAPDKITDWIAGDVHVRRGADGQWTLVQPATGVLDVEAVKAAVGVFAQLRAASFDRPKTAADHALGVVYRAGTGSTTNWLTVSSTGFAAADTVELTFQLEAPVFQTLSRPLVTPPAP
jgi:hypothetical protein